MHSHAIYRRPRGRLLRVGGVALSCTVTLSPIGVVSVPLKPGGGQVIESAVGPMIIIYAAQLRNVRPHDDRTSSTRVVLSALRNRPLPAHIFLARHKIRLQLTGHPRQRILRLGTPGLH